MKILITGASGLLGRAIKKELERFEAWQVLGLGFSRLTGGLRKVNMLHESEIVDVIEDFKPEIVIHSAAERRPDNVKHKIEETKMLNVTASEIIAKNVNKYGGFVVYISTDYVFDGTSPPYATTSKTNPLNDYGKSKLDGEIATATNCERHAILRVPILYGDIEHIKESAVTELFELLKNNSRPAKVSDHQKRYPTKTSDVAIVCREIVEYKQKNPEWRGGVFQWQGDEQLTKYSMVKIMSEIFNLPMNHIIPDTAPPSSGTPRPYNCQMDYSALENLGMGKHRTCFREGIESSLCDHL